MDTEIHLLQDVMDCWEVMNISDLSSNANLIDCKWVYKVKFRGNVHDKHHARIVTLELSAESRCILFSILKPNGKSNFGSSCHVLNEHPRISLN
jgi:hypothetical protein